MTASSTDQDNSAEIAYWNARAAVTWTTLQERLDTLFAPLTEIALDAAAPAAGEHAIDIGCGCGASLLALAERIGPTGSVHGFDISEPMAARARERIAAAGAANASVTLSDASTHDFVPGRADLLFSRFGVMFFADPAGGFANLHRAMRPGGRLLCVAWRRAADNPWFTAPLEAAAGVVPPLPPGEPDAPGPFAFADADRVRLLFAEAGWKDVALARHDLPMRLAPPGQIDQALDLVTRVGALSRALAEQGPDVQARARQVVAAGLKDYDSPAGITLTGSIWLISARA